MARIVLTNNAKFRPYSFDEMLKPLAMATQEYNAIEEGIAELGSKADLMRMYANEEPNSKVANMYNTYANDLDKQAESLAKQGLSPASRGNLLGLKRRYSSEIIPIETAVTRRRQLAEEQRKARAQDDSILFDIDARTMSLDDLVNNPELSYSSASGKNIMENVSKAASVLAKEARNDPNKFNSVLGGDYYEYVKQYGFSKEAVMDAILRSKNASNILTSIVDDALASSGVGKNWSGNAYDRALDYANRGLWSAVGQTQTQLVDNWRAKMDETDRRKGIQAEQARLNSLAINPLNIYNSRELSAEEKKYKDTVEKFSDYFTTDANGKVKLTEEGMKEYRRNASTRVTSAGSGSGTARLMNVETGTGVKGYEPSEFKKFMDSIGMNPEQGTMDNWNAAAIGNLWQNYLANDPSAKTSKYDATRVTEFDYPIAGAQQVDMKDAILTANRGKDYLEEVDYDSKSKQFKDTGEKIKTEDLKSDKYKVTATRFSPYGNTVMVQDDKGNVRRFRMPTGINTYNEGFRDEMLRDALDYQELLKNPNLSLADRLAYQEEYKKVIQQAYLYHSQLGVQNKIKEQEFNPYGY